MNNYLVFAYYNPAGGMNDFQLDFSEANDAINFLNSLQAKEQYGLRGHVYSALERRIIYNLNTHEQKANNNLK